MPKNCEADDDQKQGCFFFSLTTGSQQCIKMLQKNKNRSVDY
jgi:hypothetical protein